MKNIEHKMEEYRKKGVDRKIRKKESNVNIQLNKLAMDQFIYLPEFLVIVCKNCKHVVLPNQIGVHFTPERPH